ncbi:hypothetical protein KDI_11690 [Dictyobacter arantiisoli]|uniref:Uncharacterized protein n=2 Tax=Dictyobacter arantiisoli TaxID=2014874 RepID=A0A5A5T8L0_9CHLR|nr:hypothetical protein KDI_11690 [Dictyobacter arantiisoli]
MFCCKQKRENLYFDMLIQTLQLLAASYVEQVQAFPTFVHIPDEVALVFSDTWLFSQKLIMDGFITHQQKVEIERLDNLLNEMSDNIQLWNLFSLETSDEWGKVRYLASNILTSLHKEKEQPNLFWLKYISQDNER